MSDTKSFTAAEGSGPAVIEFNSKGIHYTFTALYQEVEGRYTVYIPAYNMVFSAKDRQAMDRKAVRIVRSFYDFHLQNDEKKTWRSFILAIHKLGFRAPNHDLIMKNLLDQSRPVKTKFSTKKSSVPNFFDAEQTKSFNVVEEIAC
jgi:hypothetical protein